MHENAIVEGRKKKHYEILLFKKKFISKNLLYCSFQRVLHIMICKSDPQFSVGPEGTKREYFLSIMQNKIVNNESSKEV